MDRPLLPEQGRCLLKLSFNDEPHDMDHRSFIAPSLDHLNTAYTAGGPICKAPMQRSQSPLNRHRYDAKLHDTRVFEPVIVINAKGGGG